MNDFDNDRGLATRIRRVLFGKPRDPTDRRVFHAIALAPLLAWVGFGADGLSSSAYGPEEAYRALGQHTYLALGLAALMITTVAVISAAYSKIIEAFPQGGGGYVVATKLLGQHAGVISGSALLVDYILTITVSVAAAGDALFSFLPPGFAWMLDWKMPFEFFAIALLTTLNIRGVKESITFLLPIFLVFAFTHVVAILGGFFAHLPDIGPTMSRAHDGFQNGLVTLGALGMIQLFMRAYSLGGGTYTGIEAVSNGLVLMREPRVRSGKRTMLYMACSLSFTAAGLLLLYLLWNVQPVEGRTMNAVLMDRLTAGLPGGKLFSVVAVLSEGALLVVAAQAGFADGPRVLSNMAVDSWVPHRFSSLSERLTTQNGVLLMGLASLAALIYTRGRVSQLVVLYSINVFVTFSLSMFAMLKHSWGLPRSQRKRRRLVALFAVGFVLCATVLVVTTAEKFHEGGWLTLVVTGGVVGLCLWIRNHYRTVVAKLNTLYAELERLPELARGQAGPIDPKLPTAAMLVAGYGGLGIHTLMNIFRAFPGFYKNVVFISVGAIDTGEFKGEGAIEQLQARTEQTLQKYVALAHKLGVPATFRHDLGTDVVAKAEELCMKVCEEFPQTTFFAGKVIFQREKWYQQILHNETAIAIQRRLFWQGRVMVILPAKVK